LIEQQALVKRFSIRVLSTVWAFLFTYRLPPSSSPIGLLTFRSSGNVSCSF